MVIGRLKKGEATRRARGRARAEVGSRKRTQCSWSYKSTRGGGGSWQRRRVPFRGGSGVEGAGWREERGGDGRGAETKNGKVRRPLSPRSQKKKRTVHHTH